jgi:hypothetical protein
MSCAVLTNAPKNKKEDLLNAPNTLIYQNKVESKTIMKYTEDAIVEHLMV